MIATQIQRCDWNEKIKQQKQRSGEKCKLLTNLNKEHNVIPKTVYICVGVKAESHLLNFSSRWPSNETCMLIWKIWDCVHSSALLLIGRSCAMTNFNAHLFLLIVCPRVCVSSFFSPCVFPTFTFQRCCFHVVVVVRACRQADNHFDLEPAVAILLVAIYRIAANRFCCESHSRNSSE